MDTLILKKTDKGLEALRTRDPALPKHLRTAFILFDGNKSVGQVMSLLPTTSPALLELEDIMRMVQAGWLELLKPSFAPRVPAPSAPVAATVRATPAAASVSTASSQAAAITNHGERYLQAYALLGVLTGEMGLRGFRLQMSVEKAADYHGLVALLPKLRTAIEAKKLRPVEKILLAPSAPAAGVADSGFHSDSIPSVLIP